ICNGFQVLLELGLIPGAMLRNKNLKFLCQHIHIRIENDQTPFTRSSKAGLILKIPIAHFDGNYYATPETLVKLKKNDQIVFRYSDPDGNISEMANVNGSMENIAGLMNLDRNVLGMMPHPERASEALIGSADGKIIFESIIDYIESRK
ncbi:MAG: phosphoribosylformylglycinamidine synthase I, partial [Candidatus Aminicenantes bacterium]|nr:phosphoribosylformylglycinamidine synthase I [Candidatus Aminicenantes bacterium]